MCGQRMRIRIALKVVQNPITTRSAVEKHLSVWEGCRGAKGRRESISVERIADKTTSCLSGLGGPQFATMYRPSSRGFPTLRTIVFANFVRCKPRRSCQTLHHGGLSTQLGRNCHPQKSRNRSLGGALLDPSASRSRKYKFKHQRFLKESYWWTFLTDVASQQ